MTEAKVGLSGTRRAWDVTGFVGLYFVQLFYSLYGFGSITDFILTRSYDCLSYGGEWECLNSYPAMVTPLFAGFILALVVPAWGIVRIGQRKIAYWVPLVAMTLLTVIFVVSYGYAVYALVDPASSF